MCQAAQVYCKHVFTVQCHTLAWAAGDTTEAPGSFSPQHIAGFNTAATVSLIIKIPLWSLKSVHKVGGPSGAQAESFMEHWGSFYKP